jgi:hypothetical protein
MGRCHWSRTALTISSLFLAPILATAHGPAGGGFGAGGVHVSGMGAAGSHGGYGGHVNHGAGGNPSSVSRGPSPSLFRGPTVSHSPNPTGVPKSADVGFMARYFPASAAAAHALGTSNSHTANFRGVLQLNGFKSPQGNLVIRGPIVNPIIYGWPFGPGGVGWGGPLWWAIGYPGWGIYDAQPADDTAATFERSQRASDFIAVGSREFRQGRYDLALRDFQHAMVEDPANSQLLLLIAQALFALGRFEDAAGSVQIAIERLGEQQWGSVVRNYPQLYPNHADYTRQLRALEKARDENPSLPAIRLLLGYHYAFLGYPQAALAELDRALQLEPRDMAARRLRDSVARNPAAPPSANRPSRRLSILRNEFDAIGLGHVEPMTDVEGQYVRGSY